MSTGININTPEYWNEVYRREWETQIAAGGSYHRDYDPIHQAIIKELAAGSRVLDIACGPGLLCRKIKLQVPGARVTGIDFSSYMIARNTERDRALGIEYACLDIRTSLSTLRSPFDVIAMCEIIEHLDNPESVVCNAISLLRPGGLFLVSCPHADEIPDPEHVREWNHESLFHLLAPYSESVTFTHFPPPYFHYWMLAQLRKRGT